MTPLGTAGRQRPWNAPFAFISGILLAIADALLHPTILLVFFVSQLTDSLRTIGLVVTVGLLGWYLPQLMVPWLVNNTSRQLPWALSANLVRAAAAIFLAYSGYRTDVSDDDRLRSFFICYVVYSVAAGFAQSPMNELIARSVPAEIRGRLFRQRTVWAGIVAIGAGVLARQTIGTDGPGFPRSFALLFIAVAAATSGAALFVGRIREPRTLNRMGPARFNPRVGDFVRVLSDGAFRRFILFGLFAGISTGADAFYVIYARREFDIPPSWIGAFLSLFAAAALLSTPFWMGIIRYSGARGVLQTAVALRVISPLIMVGLPYALESDLYQDNVSNERIVFYILAVPIAIFGITARGLAIGNFRYVMDLSVGDRRTAYQILALTPMLLAAAAPIAGAEIAERWGFDRLFLSAVFVGFVSVLCSGLLAGTSRRVRASSAAWRLKEARS